MNKEKSVANTNKNKKGKTALIIIAVIVIIYALLQVLPYAGFSGSSKFLINEGEAPMVIAHGGAKHLYPENTVMAFEESFAMGVDVLETDLCLTKDGILITHHDLTVDATANTSGSVNSFTLKEINEMNFGYHFVDLNGEKPYESESDEETLSRLIPMTVEQMFQTFGTNTLYVMEIKDAGETGIAAAEELNRLIEHYDLQEYVCVASFHAEVIEHFSKIKDDNVNISMDYDTSFQFILLNYLGFGMFSGYEHAGLQLPPSNSGVPLDNSYISYKVHHNNMFLHYWTINDKEQMRELIEIGCDGIITDRPDLMFELLEEMGFNS